jgi:hypothetical protein
VKDELWLRTWNDGHPHFSGDLHRSFLWVFAQLRRLSGSILRAGQSDGPGASMPIVIRPRHKAE